MNRVKTVSIVMLVILSIAQLSSIWNVNVNNIFGTSYNIIATNEEKQEILLPNKVYVDIGEGIYKLGYNISNNLPVMKNAIEVIKKTSNNGEFVSKYEIEKYSLNGFDVIYKYFVNVDYELLKDAIDIENKTFEKEGIVFDEIYIDFDKNNVCYYNSKTSELWEYKVQDLVRQNNVVFNENVAFRYSDDERTLLIPFVVDEYYLDVIESNPYSINGEVLAISVENQINRFFATPSEKWTIFGEDSYIFSGEEITVKYTNENILEYKNNYQTKQKVSKAEAYAIAKNFIEKDIVMSNDIVLKKVEAQENSYIFYFNPVINNTEIAFNNEILDYFITIEVTNGIVKYYKKYAMNYDSTYTDTQVLNKDLELLSIDNDYNGVNIVYLQDMKNLSVSLAWAMTYEDRIVYNLAD